MLLSYLKGSSASVLSSVATFFVITPILSKDFSFHNMVVELYPFLFIATFFGYGGGLLASGILWFYSGKENITFRKIAIFAGAGILFGLILELITEFAAAPLFFLSAMVGAFTFLMVQRIQNKLIGWSIVLFHFALFFIYPQVFAYLHLLPF